MQGPAGYIDKISLFIDDTARDSRTGWKPGDLAYVYNSGYGYYDGNAWHPIGTETEELAYLERTTDATAASGTTITLLTTTVTFTDQTTCELVANLPSLDFTATSGGEAAIIVNYGTPPTTYTLGRVQADRALAWPIHLSRRVPITTTGQATLELAAQSITGPITLHATDDYGAITFAILAK